MYLDLSCGIAVFAAPARLRCPTNGTDPPVCIQVCAAQDASSGAAVCKVRVNNCGTEQTDRDVNQAFGHLWHPPYRPAVILPRRGLRTQQRAFCELSCPCVSLLYSPYPQSSEEVASVVAVWAEAGAFSFKSFLSSTSQPSDLPGSTASPTPSSTPLVHAMQSINMFQSDTASLSFSTTGVALSSPTDTRYALFCVCELRVG